VSEAPTLVWSRESRFTRVRYEDIRVVHTGYLIKGILPEKGVGFIAGASKGGKTFIALDWGQKVATGATVMRRKAKHVGVAYVAAEDPEGCRARIQAWKRRYPRGSESYTPFTLLPCKVNLLDDDHVAELIAELQDLAEEYATQDMSLGLVVLDTLSKCMPGADENTSADGSRAVAALERIQAELDCFVLAVAHHGKAGADNGIRGWSGFDAASDATITVTRDPENPQARTLTLSKVKNGEDGHQVAFRLERQDLGERDQDDEELWSCIVTYDSMPPEQAAKVKRKAMSAEAQLIWTHLGRLVDSGNCQPVPAEFDPRPHYKAVRRADLSLECSINGLQYDGEKPNTYNQRFGRKLIELRAQGRVRIEGDLIWAL
jgi:hypothetical protein